MQKEILWRVSDGKFTIDYIRAGSLDEAKEIFDAKHYNPAVEFQPTTDTIHAVYFSDSPGSPAFFKGTKADAIKGARLYKRQWQSAAVIDRVVRI